LIDEDGIFVAQICHIEAASTNGERFNPNMTDEERRAPENLLVLCYRHHKKTNDTEIYDASALLRMKEQHEALWIERIYTIPDEAIERLLDDEVQFWNAIENENISWLGSFDLALEVPVSRYPLEEIERLTEHVDWIEKFVGDVSSFTAQLPDEISKFLLNLGYDPKRFDEVKYYENPFANAYWEYFNIGFPNWIMKYKRDVLILKIHIAYTALRQSPHDLALGQALQNAKDELTVLAQSSIYVD